MNRRSPAIQKFLGLLLAAAFLTASVPTLAPAQQPKNSRQSANNSTAGAAAAVSTLFDLGAEVLSSVTRYGQYDPYSQFRGARYTNAGLISERDEIRLGAQFHQEVIKKFKLTSAGQERVNRLGQRVARTSLRPNIVYRFFVVQGREINAFSAPGGYIYVTTALLALANDDELAAVLSHEVAHVVARHSLKSLQNSQALSQLADLVGSVTGVAGKDAGELGTIAARVVGSGLLAVHSREEEREADFLGVRGLPRAGFDPEAMISMFQKLQRLQKSEPDLLGTLFSDHPDVQERIDNTRYEINNMRRNASR
ncbi:MAG TPA: M48 family metallopeptidase [Pyrinomonadaceae bacterium]|jgi:predicted Zn-dependent protease